ncbi:hypothetical protein [Acidovorax sp. FHTAMBA]|uniref:hypothetical protein n=1 Tax=Acidovorax sp. FHTAMBA TaxID=3140252 RepID=UPI00318373F5
MTLPQEVDASSALTPPSLAVAPTTDTDHYNAWAEQRVPYSQRVRRWPAGQRPNNQTNP